MTERVTIRQLQTDKPGLLLVAMIIFYNDPRELKGKGRGVWNVTLRDSAEDTINMTVWESIDGLKEYVKRFKFGDIVEIRDPLVQSRITEDQYRPEVSSTFTLTLSDAETRKALVRWDAPPGEIEAWSPLLAIPTKPPQSYSKLSDLYLTGAVSSPDQERNLLVAIATVGDVRTGQSKTYDQYVFRRVTVYDQSSPNKRLLITLWNSLAERADCWTPKETILFISDAKIVWEENRIGIYLSQKTVVTENPSIPDADWLREYATKNTPMSNVEILQDFVAAISDPNTIQDIMTISTLINKCKKNEGRTWDQVAFTAMMYAGVVGFDIDEPKERTLRPQCSTCKSWLATYDTQCYNSQCVGNPDRFTGAAFDLRVTLADHTGELRHSRLTGSAAEKALNCSAYQFEEASEAKVSALKWHYLMERVVVRIAVQPPSTPDGMILSSILSLELACPLDVAQNIPMH